MRPTERTNPCDKHTDCFARDSFGNCRALHTTWFEGECPFYKNKGDQIAAGGFAVGYKWEDDYGERMAGKK